MVHRAHRQLRICSAASGFIRKVFVKYAQLFHNQSSPGRTAPNFAFNTDAVPAPVNSTLDITFRRIATEQRCNDNEQRQWSFQCRDNDADAQAI